jgi:hypothetical protein
MVGGSKVRPILRVVTRKRIPADNNAYVYSGTGTVSVICFENSIVKRFQNGGNGSPNGLRINESEPSDADVADIFALT